jgi:hypothetical protein
MLAFCGNALATSTTVIYTVEGATSCNSFSSNAIQSLSVSAISAGLGTVGFIDYTISDDFTGLEKWSVREGNPKVNFVILTGGKVSGKTKSEVYHFGSVGTDSDSDVPGPGQSLASVTFCYGLTGTAPPPPEPEVIPDCDDLLANGGDIDKSVVECPESGKRFIFSVDPYAPNGGIQACTCNFAEPKTTCDPAIPAGDPSGLGCLPDPMAEGNGLDWVPAEIMIFQNGTGYCYTTSSGGRICVR